MAVQRQTVIALTAGASIVVALGVLGILHGTTLDPEQIKAEFQSRFDQLNRMPENDPIAREALAKELLANDVYKQHAKALYFKLEKLYLKIHEAAQLERAAQKEVAPFLAKCKDLRRVPPDELEALLGEVNALIRNYNTTRLGEELRRIAQELKARCDLILRCTAQDVIALNRDVQKEIKEGRFAQAHALITEFEKKYVNAGDFDTQLRELKQQVLRKAEPEAAKILAEGRTSEDARKKALARLEGQDFKGLPLPAIEAAVRELKRR